MKRIFISYSRNDERFARQLAGSLTDIGAEVWIDVKSIPAGEKWSTAIQNGLRDCDVMILILTPSSTASVNVEEEWQYFRDNLKPIFPILLEKTGAHYQISRLQYINFLEQPYETAFNQLHGQLLTKGVQLAPLSEIATAPDNSDPLPILERRPAATEVTPRLGLTAGVLGQTSGTDARTMSPFERWYLGLNGAIVAVLLFGVLLFAGGNDNFPFLSTVITLLIAYVALSLLTIAIIALGTSLLNLRARRLRAAIIDLLPDPAIQARVLAHPQIDLEPIVLRQSLWTRISKLFFQGLDLNRVTNIDRFTFANVLIEVLLPENLSVRQLRQRRGEELVALLTSRVNSPELAASLESILSEVDTLPEAQTIFAAWFDTGVRRTEALAARTTQLAALTIGFILALQFNVDTVSVTLAALQEAELQASITAAAQAAGDLEFEPIPTPEATADPFAADITEIALNETSAAIEELLAMGRVPIGWHYTPARNGCFGESVSFYCSDTSNIWLVFPSNNPDWVSFMVRKVLGLGLTALIVFFFASLGYALTRGNRVFA